MPTLDWIGKKAVRNHHEDHDFIIVYANNGEIWRPNPVLRSAEADKRYKNIDKDPRGLWKTSDLSAHNPYSEGTYPIISPSGRIIDGPPKGSYWRVSESKLKELDCDNRIWFRPAKALIKINAPLRRKKSTSTGGKNTRRTKHYCSENRLKWP
jgi:hypothetical protein